MSTVIAFLMTRCSNIELTRSVVAKCLVLGLSVLFGVFGILELSASTDEATSDSSTSATLTVDDGDGDAAVMSRGEINSSGDIDWWGADLTDGQMYRIAMKGSTTSDERTLYTPYIIGVYKSNDDYVDGTDDFLSGLERDARVHYYADTTAKHWIAVRGINDETGTYDLRLLEVDDDSQPDNTSTPSNATLGAATDTFKIDYRGDSDWFSIDLEANKRYRSTVVASDYILWPVSRGRDPDGDLIEVERDRANNLKYRTWFTTGATAGKHYIEVRSNHNQAGRYTLEVIADSTGGM